MALMNGFLTDVGAASRSEWLAACRDCPETTFFQTPYWAELFSSCFPDRFRTATRRFRFQDDTVVIFPLTIKRHMSGLLRIAFSMPGSTFGGWLTPTPLLPGHESAILRYLQGYSNLIVRENPLNPIRETIVNGSFKDDYTQIIDLRDGYQAVWERTAFGHKKAVRRALRRGVQIREAVDLKEWEEYYEMYIASIDRWKKRNIYTGVSYDRRFFLKIRQLDPSLRKLWIATLADRCIAGVLCFYWNRHAVAWHGAGLSEYFSYYPNNLICDRAIAHADDAGFRWFDCNPSSGLSGVDAFKQSLGAKPLRSRILFRSSPIYTVCRMVRCRMNVKH
jgi:hypothetical protein